MNEVEQSFEFESTNPEMTQAFGAALGSCVEAGQVLALEGDLGAGKTKLVQGLAHGLDVTESVNSPTFILANEYYSGRLPLYHIDAYRVADAVEARSFGLDDYLNGDGVTVIEWAERVEPALPRERLWITLEYLSETARRVRVTASGARYQKILQNVREKVHARAVGN